MTSAGHHTMMQRASTPPAPPAYWGLYFEAEEPNVIVNMTKTGSAPVLTLETSTDGETWIPFDHEGATPVTLARIGDRIYFRAGIDGNRAMALSDASYHMFDLSGKCGAHGNITSLLNGKAPTFETNASNIFEKLFYDCTSLTTAPEIPLAGHLSVAACLEMFKGCTSLRTAPSSLPATTIDNYCYNNMFYGCTSLTTVPVIAAMTCGTYACYGMFRDCTSLTTAPELPATTLVGQGVYAYMFSGCTSLTTAPELPATTLANNCYAHMFSGCTSLTTAPELPATTLASNCYAQMFRACTSLTTAPELPATTLTGSCYSSLFNGCVSLVSVKVNFTAWTRLGTASWLKDVAASGTLECPTALGTNETITRSASRCPKGWTVINID